MTIPNTIHGYLNRAGVPYDIIMHGKTGCALQNANAAHIPCDKLAKGVVLRSAGGYILATIPASRQVRLNEVGSFLHHPVCLATEMEIRDLFDDCSPGAIPALGDAYHIFNIIDNRLEGLGDIFFEGGDHYSLIHIKGKDFDALTDDDLHADISRRH